MLGVLALWGLMLVPLFFWNACPCCGGTFCTRCFVNDTLEWSVTLSGLAACSGTDVNGTYILQEQTGGAASCQWQSDTGATVKMRIAVSSADIFSLVSIRLFIDVGANLSVAEYRVGSLPVSTGCRESFVLSLFATSGYCDAIWPATVTLDPYP